MVILGAGPTGLGAAYRAIELGHRDVHVFEAAGCVGGLARSERDAQGFTWDVGGHVLFSHYDYYDKVFETLVGDDHTLNNRESYIRILDRWVAYPFQNNIRQLPKEAVLECLTGLIRTQRGGDSLERARGASHFGEFIDAAFGEGIGRLFMRPYNFKVWAHHPEQMSKEWIGERVAMIDLERALSNVIMEKDDPGWGPNNQFKFPIGGTGDFYDRFVPVLDGHLHLHARATEIDVDAKVVRFAGGREERYDTLLSTMPVDVLCRDVLVGDVPDEIRQAASALTHSSGHMVGIGIKRPAPRAWSWMYFPEDNCPFYRVTYLSNYSPRMTPDPEQYYSLLCETSSSAEKPVDESTILEETIRGLENVGLLEPGEREDIVSTWVCNVEYSYPVPTVDRDELLSIVIPWLESKGISSRGRFGMWKYEVANTDHSLMQGVEWVNRELCGDAEHTIGIVYASTSDGRNAASHERPGVAGSGEKRLKSQQPPIGEEELGVTIPKRGSKTTG